MERSHGTWKRKVAYDLTNDKNCKWLKSLGEYAYQFNTSPHLSIDFRRPFEVFYQREVNGIVLESDSDVHYDSSLLLITMANQSKISKHKLGEPNDAEKQAMPQCIKSRGEEKSSKNESC